MQNTISNIFNSLVVDPIKRTICYYDTEQCRNTSKIAISMVCGISGGLASHYGSVAMGISDNEILSVVVTSAVGTGVSMIDGVSNAGENIRNWACEG